MESVQEIEIQLHHMRIAAKRWGDGSGVPLLATHGWLDNAATFDHIAPLLSGIDLIAIDLPGHGLSQHRHKGDYYHFIDYVADVSEIVDTLGWDKFSLLGHSMGGSVMALVAATLPDRVEKLALIESLGPYSQDASEAPTRLAKAIHQRKNRGSRRSPVYRDHEQMIQMRKAVGSIKEESVRTLLSRNIKEIKGGYTWRSDYRLTLSSLYYLSDDTVLSFLRKIVSPVLFIQALEGVLDRKDYLRQRLDCIQNLDHKILKGLHHLHLDDPEPVAALVQNFLFPRLTHKS